MKMSEIETALVRTINECRTLGVPESDLDSMVSLAEAHEPGVALEDLCVQLVEYDVVVPIAIYETLVELGSAMETDPAYWTRLPTK